MSKRKISEQKLFNMVNDRLAQGDRDTQLVASASEEELREFGFYYLVDITVRPDCRLQGLVVWRHVPLPLIAWMLGLLRTKRNGHLKHNYDFGPSIFVDAPVMDEATLVAKELVVIEDVKVSGLT